MVSSLLGFIPGGVGVPEMLIVGIIALLLFGKRLPEVAKSLGKGIVEFKKGIQGIEDDVRHGSSSSHSSSTYARPDVQDDEPEMSAPKFEPPTFETEEVKETVENKEVKEEESPA